MKLVMGIFSIVLSVVVGLQSMIAGFGNTVFETGEFGGTAGFVVSILMLVAGIVALVQRTTTGNSPLIMFLVAGFIGFIGAGSYADLNIWAGVCLLFAIITFFANRKNKKSEIVK